MVGAVVVNVVSSVAGEAGGKGREEEEKLRVVEREESKVGSRKGSPPRAVFVDTHTIRWPLSTCALSHVNRTAGTSTSS